MGNIGERGERGQWMRRRASVSERGGNIIVFHEQDIELNSHSLNSFKRLDCVEQYTFFFLFFFFSYVLMALLALAKF